MSVASRKRSREYVERVNARTPEWAHDQIRRQGVVYALAHSAGVNSADIVERFQVRRALLQAMNAIGIIWKKREKPASLDKTVIRTKA